MRTRWMTAAALAGPLVSLSALAQAAEPLADWPGGWYDGQAEIFAASLVLVLLWGGVALVIGRARRDSAGSGRDGRIAGAESPIPVRVNDRAGNGPGRGRFARRGRGLSG